MIILENIKGMGKIGINKEQMYLIMVVRKTNSTSRVTINIRIQKHIMISRSKFRNLRTKRKFLIPPSPTTKRQVMIMDTETNGIKKIHSHKQCNFLITKALKIQVNLLIMEDSNTGQAVDRFQYNKINNNLIAHSNIHLLHLNRQPALTR